MPLRYEITHVDIPSEPEFLSRFTNWVVDGPPNEELFRAVVPAGAKKVEFKVNAKMKK